MILLIPPDEGNQAMSEGRPMTKEESEVILSLIISRYTAVRQPKYRNADLEQLSTDYTTLREMSELQGVNLSYRNILNAISQTLKKMTAVMKSDRICVSEKGLNKVIRPLRRKKDHVIQYPVEWVDDKTRQLCFINNGLWDDWNYMVMDALAYMLLMKEGEDRFPQKVIPVFGNLESINRREEELNGNPKEPNAPPAPSDTADISWIKNHKYWVRFDDAEFNRLTRKSLKSIEILNLLLNTARVEFKLAYPVKVKSENGPREHLYRMNVFSRFFELVSIEKERADGIVQRREYHVCFNTILGELFVHNLKSKYYDLLDSSFYHLPQNAQVFYRRFFLHHTYERLAVNLETIVERLNLSDRNITNLMATIENNVLNPLMDAGLIKSFGKMKSGRKNKKWKYTIDLPSKKDSDQAGLESVNSLADNDRGSVK